MIAAVGRVVSKGLSSTRLESNLDVRRCRVGYFDANSARDILEEESTTNALLTSSASIQLHNLIKMLDDQIPFPWTGEVEVVASLYFTTKYYLVLLIISSSSTTYQY